MNKLIKWIIHPEDFERGGRQNSWINFPCNIRIAGAKNLVCDRLYAFDFGFPLTVQFQAALDGVWTDILKYGLEEAGEGNPSATYSSVGGPIDVSRVTAITGLRFMVTSDQFTYVSFPNSTGEGNNLPHYVTICCTETSFADAIKINQ